MLKIDADVSGWLFGDTDDAVVGETILADRLGRRHVLDEVRDGQDVSIVLDGEERILRKSEEDISDGETVAWNYVEVDSEGYAVRFLKIEND